MNLKIGDRVINKKAPQWGLGQIVEFNGLYCKIFFVNFEDGYATFKKDTLDIMEKVEGKDTDHPLLNNLKLPDKDLETTKYRLISDLILQFLKIFPNGFYDEKYLDQERKLER